MNECSFGLVFPVELALMTKKKKGVQNPLNTLIVYLLFVLFNQTKL